MAADIMKRLAEARKTMPALQLYVLVDGLHYESCTNAALREGPGVIALFADTVDAHLAPAGPWLLAVEKLSPALLEQISRLEAIAPAVSWIIGPQDLQGLAQLLRLCMQMGLPDGRTALLRFWDPRVLAAAARDLKAAQRHTLFGHLFEWHLLLDGRRVHIGRPT
ncbi:DUF4123 domain-containing protein [Herbaspirillum huttiense]|uniref:DUF4123 domain-containing protein n=1 Tax=Herbaspirillum huttiense TaxID=863372 RepID=UPI00106676F1|nr:DUF4123 domain-containing protein [Herbaspirillum huttiense]QBP77860.1 DUF4123 domain-containing protein [Herbaspirillum huttiense]